jgi:hypothetical protein
MPDDLTITLSRCAVVWFATGFITGFGFLLVVGTLILSGGKGHDSQW